MVRAVHLEIEPDMSKEAFLHSLKQFSAPSKAFNTVTLSHEMQSYQHSKHTLLLDPDDYVEPTVTNLSRRLNYLNQVLRNDSKKIIC